MPRDGSVSCPDSALPFFIVCGASCIPYIGVR
jgi:hypothetical protein